MLLSGKGSVEEQEKVMVVDTDEDGEPAMEWAVENLLKKNPNDVDLVPKGSLMLAGAELEQFILPFRGSHAQKGILAGEEVILHDIGFPGPLIDYVTANSISHLVVGTSGSAFSRKLSTSDVEKSLLESAPNTCSIYIVAKGKLQTVRYAKKAPQSPTSDLGYRTETYPSRVEPSPVQTNPPDTYDVARSSYSTASAMGMVSDTSFSVKSNDSMSYTWQKTGFPAKPLDYDTVKSLSNSSVSEVSDFSARLSFQSTDMSGNSFASMSSHVPVNVEDELAKLHLQFKESLSVYNMACQDAAAAEQKAMEIRQMKNSRFRSSEDSRPPRKDSWSTLTDTEKCKKRNNALVKKEMVSSTGKDQRRYSEPATSEDVGAGEKRREPDHLPRIDVCCRKYTIEQIEEATEYFSSSRKIGEGGYGPVFKGVLDHAPVAIKVLRPDVSQGLRQFNQEVEILSSMRHPNMVILAGACPEYGCLVYEYMDNGNLEDRLLCKGGTPPIPWRARFEIAADIATGLAFLHQARPEPVVHRDIKPSNILLDGNYASKISDVGLARLVPVSVAKMTEAAGTFCYIDPEYQQTGMLGVKSDVYSLGVVLLQIITAKPPMGLALQVEDAIRNGRFPAILDPGVVDWPVEEALALAKLALKCCELQRKDRPDLTSDVLPELIRLKNLRQEKAAEKMANDGSRSEQEPEVIDMRSAPSQIKPKGRWHERFKSIAGNWNLKNSFRKPRIFPGTNRRRRPEKKDQVFVEGCWSFASCSKPVPQIKKFNSFS